MSTPLKSNFDYNMCRRLEVDDDDSSCVKRTNETLTLTSARLSRGIVYLESVEFDFALETGDRPTIRSTPQLRQT